MTWPELAERLTTVLSALAVPRHDDTVLIIADRTESACYVQYSGGGDAGGVWAEVSSNTFRPRHRRLSKEDQAALGAAGWRAPSGQVPNWWSDRFADPTADSRPLADMTVTALRDVMRLSTPLVLEYEAFVLSTGEQVGLPELEALGLSRRGDSNP